MILTAGVSPIEGTEGAEAVDDVAVQSVCASPQYDRVVTYTMLHVDHSANLAVQLVTFGAHSDTKLIEVVVMVVTSVRGLALRLGPDLDDLLLWTTLTESISMVGVPVGIA